MFCETSQHFCSRRCVGVVRSVKAPKELLSIFRSPSNVSEQYFGSLHVTKGTKHRQVENVVAYIFIEVFYWWVSYISAIPLFWWIDATVREPCASFHYRVWQSCYFSTLLKEPREMVLSSGKYGRVSTSSCSQRQRKVRRQAKARKLGKLLIAAEGKANVVLKISSEQRSRGGTQGIRKLYKAWWRRR